MKFIKNILAFFKELIKEKDFSFIILVVAMFLLPLSILLSSYAIVISILFKIVQVIFFKHKFYASNLLRTSSFIGLFFFVYVMINSVIQTNFTYTISIFEQEYVRLPLLFLVPIILRKKK